MSAILALSSFVSPRDLAVLAVALLLAVMTVIGAGNIADKPSTAL